MGGNSFAGYFDSRNLVLYLIRLSMKKFFTIIAAFLPLCTLIAQTYLNQNFGSTKAQVQEFLKTRKLLNVTNIDDNTLQATADAFSVTYYFDEGKLYKLETRSDFGNRKDANAALEGFRDQFSRLQSTVLNLSNDKDLVRFAARHGRELNEVSSYSLDKSHAQVRVMTLDLDRAPSEELSELQHDHALFAIAQK